MPSCQPAAIRQLHRQEVCHPAFFDGAGASWAPCDQCVSESSFEPIWLGFVILILITIIIMICMVASVIFMIVMTCMIDGSYDH